MPADNVVHIVDDDEAVRKSLAFLLGTAQASARSYETAISFLANIDSVERGCIISDLRMPGIDGLELVRRLKILGVDLPVIIITGHGDIALAGKALEAGAVDFLEKPFDDEAVLAAVRSAFRQQERDTTRETKGVEVQGRFAHLSNTERQVLEGLIAGYSNKTIADDLKISPRTFEIYRANVMAKTQASNLSELVRLAFISDRS
ncbi:response regulator FixJ [Mesorhizobium sp. M4B.F.Ca.ET.049.02.1.2]|uniref:response regulator FixJ n=1 Tax=Mesorhizobium sp. M4B.F.Ca.ET.049.02.1.2 TaxID=2496752 RepID=UPI000FCB742E|nr:response regulator FixJ [Mesorhizobium sp. M4B.F.Ca.ET.049.02.1.2]RUW65895.1 response regulator [Mesorhizobium sp. M4B.F.Ca.ET.049.02.1.2]TIV25088.1 MAG: response regulator [Mesorhizobium sp.]TKB09172.1 MAG: response regulator [Mesorhizobium sp.]